METTLEDVREKYKQCLHYTQVNSKIAFEPIKSSPEHPNQANPKILAKWFYESSVEWLKDYDQTVRRCKQGCTTLEIHHEIPLKEEIDSFKERLEDTFDVNL